MDKQKILEELKRLQERDCDADNPALLAYANAIHLANQLPDMQEPCEVCTKSNLIPTVLGGSATATALQCFISDKKIENNFCPNCGRKLEAKDEV